MMVDMLKTNKNNKKIRYLFFLVHFYRFSLSHIPFSRIYTYTVDTWTQAGFLPDKSDIFLVSPKERGRRNAYPNTSTFYQECKQNCQLWTPSSKHQLKTPWPELDCYLSNYIPFLGTRGCKRANWWPQLHIVFTCIVLTHRRVATFLKPFLQNNFPFERSIKVL